MEKRKRLLALMVALDNLVMATADGMGALDANGGRESAKVIQSLAIDTLYQIADGYNIDMAQELGWGITSQKEKMV